MLKLNKINKQNRNKKNLNMDRLSFNLAESYFKQSSTDS